MPATRHPHAVRSACWLLANAALVLLGACGSAPRSPQTADHSGRDGVEANPPAGLERLPDAEPRVEPLRSGGPNKPYEVLGQSYTPVTTDRALRETGLASWYGRKFHGRPTASGERYDMYAMTGAHKTMPLPSYARVRNPANGREIIVRINDRGPFHSDRVIDLSYAAALKLGLLAGVARVEVERLTNEDIRAGLWQRGRTVAEPPPVSVDMPPAATKPAPPYRADDDPLMALLAAPPTTAPPTPQTTAPNATAGIYWLQLGAFRQRDSATQMQRRLQRDADWLAPLLAVFDERNTYRVQAGPFATRGEALGHAERLRGLLPDAPLVVERR